MSLYACLDLLNQQLGQLGDKPSWKARPFLSKLFSQPNSNNTVFLSAVKEKFEQRIINDDYENLAEDIAQVKNHLKKKMARSTRKVIEIILKDLEAINSGYQQSKTTTGAIEIALKVQQKVPASVLNSYLKYQASNSHIAEIRQAKLFKQGTSSGECLGFTYAMANPALSLYVDKSLKPDLNWTVYYYQKGQAQRKTDQQDIKRSRLTPVYFCPNPTEQAKRLLDKAKFYQGKDLYISKKGKISRHACYLSVRKKGKIRYMDPNQGAFLFSDEKDFIEFYTCVAHLEKAAGYDYRFLSLNELKYDESRKSKEIKTWSGILRTLLTGTKYQDNQTLLHYFTLGFYIASSIFVNAALGQISYISVILAVLLSEIFYLWAMAEGHSGLLAIPHLLMDKGQDLKEKISDLSPQNTLEAQADKKQGSTKQILSKTGFETANAGVQNTMRVKPLEKIKKETNPKQADFKLTSASESALGFWTPPQPSPIKTLKSSRSVADKSIRCTEIRS